MGYAGEKSVLTLGAPLSCFGVLGGGGESGWRNKDIELGVSSTSDCITAGIFWG